jgi:hypothetical protein
MNYRRRRRFFFFPLIPIAAALLLGLIVMLLWNAILPQVVNAAPLSYWQAVGLLVLCRILFGSFFKGRPQFNSRSGWRGGAPWRSKWMNMSEEEKAKFREEWKKRCGPPGDRSKTDS